MDRESADVIEMIIEPEVKNLGAFTVRRTLPGKTRQMVGPFIFFDHMGPADFEPGQGVDVRAHPHIGIATITYLFSGEILHRDSLGHEQVIARGAVNWMTAGRGIVHSERTPVDLKKIGSHLHGIQSWIALPLDKEEVPPAFDHYAAKEIPSTGFDGVEIRVVAGAAFGLESPVRTASPTLYVEVDMARDASLDLPDDCEELGVYVVKGKVRIGTRDVNEGTMAVIASGRKARAEALAGTKLMLLGGARLEGERTIWWNFVSSSRERIEQAKRDWREKRFDKVPNESEFIPLPEA